MVVDLFAGGGGASLGIEQAFGRAPDIAVNHDADAIAMHAANHPDTRHFRCDVFEVDPIEVTQGRQVGLLWASPDCKHFSKAKGGKPRSKKIRSLAWVVVKWAAAVRPRVIMLENVEEFVTWGPLDATGRPCPRRKGATFRRWIADLRRLGYRVDWRELRACDYGAPTIRKRFILIARRDGLPIVWPDATHGDPTSAPVRAGRRKPWRTAAECMDWALPCPSIFLTPEQARSAGCRRPLAAKTLQRIARGIDRFVVNASEPFVVPIQNYGWGAKYFGTSEPMRTITAWPKGGGHALVTAFLEQANGGFYTGSGRSLATPAGTVCAQGSMQRLATVNLARASAAQPDRRDQVRAFLVAYYGSEQTGISVTDPMRTVVSHERFGLVTVAGHDHVITDIGLRMLTPRELFRAQGFPDTYIIDQGENGRRLSKTAQVRMCGNSVCPPLSRALVAENLRDLIAIYDRMQAA